MKTISRRIRRLEESFAPQDLERLGIGVERTSDSILYLTGIVAVGPGIQAAVN